MPGEVREYVHIASPNGPALWSANENDRRAMYKKMDDKIYHSPIHNGSGESEYTFYSDLKKQPWIIWPLWVEDEWGSDYVTVIWHSKATPEEIALFNQLVSYAIIDPRRSPNPDGNQRHLPISSRLERIRSLLFEFWEKAGFNLQNIRAMNVLCSPMSFNEATSGERCFAVVKALADQSKSMNV